MTNTKTISTQEMINDFVLGTRFEKANRNSTLNREKLSNCGLEHAKRYDLGNNIHVAFYPARRTMGKVFYWGERQITKETAQKRLGLIK